MAEIKVEDVSRDKVGAESDGTARVDQAEDVWDEERLEKAMDTLKEIYIQVCTTSNSRRAIH